MTNMAPIPQVPGENDGTAANDKYIDAMGGRGDGDRLDPDLNEDQVDSAEADYAAATEGTVDDDENME